jgi:hypothetical protein
MTVENDGLPPTEGDPEPDGLEPATELLPLDAVNATKQAAADAAARRAQLNSPANPGTHVYPAPPPMPAGGSVPRRAAAPPQPPAPPTETSATAAARTVLPPPTEPTGQPGEPAWPTETAEPEDPTRLLPRDQLPPQGATTARGSMEGDLFDEGDPTPGRAP